MLAGRLVAMIENHAEDLTRGVLRDLQANPRTPAYHTLALDELQRRVYDVYHNLGRWIGDKAEESIERTYTELGRRRRAEGVPLDQVVYALLLTKHHLRDYVRSSGLVDTPLELQLEEELNVLLENFFDKAVWLTVKGYSQAN